jgi:HNH endonuclease
MSIAAVQEQQSCVQEMPLERVEAELCTLAGQIAAATSRFLALLADFDARDGWAGWGVRSCAHWLSWRCGLDLRTAREHVRVARALRGLPKVSSALAEGRISYSKARAVSRVATPENEGDLVHAALHNPAAHLDRLVRGLLKARREDDEHDPRPQPRNQVQWRWDDDGSLVLWGRLAAEDGARVLAGLARMDEERRRVEHLPEVDASRDPTGATDGSAEPPNRLDGSAEPSWSVSGRAPSDLGPALVAAADLRCTQVEAPVFAPAADVVVHADVESVISTTRDNDDQGPQETHIATPRIDDGPALRDSVLRMLTCDARLQLAVHALDGRTLDLGRALWRRDRGCAHPGCGRTRFLHAHHVTPWAAGGRTDLDNLVLLCGEHHRHLHDGGFTIVALGRQRFRFHGPRGAVRPPAPKMAGDLARLTRAHPNIAPGTIEADWDGTPLDLPHAVDVYLTGWANRAARPEARPLAAGASAATHVDYARRQTKIAVPGTNRPR